MFTEGPTPSIIPRLRLRTAIRLGGATPHAAADTDDFVPCSISANVRVNNEIPARLREELSDMSIHGYEGVISNTPIINVGYSDAFVFKSVIRIEPEEEPSRLRNDDFMTSTFQTDGSYCIHPPRGIREELLTTIGRWKP